MTKETDKQSKTSRPSQVLQDCNEFILECAGEGIYGVDLQGRATFVNSAASQMLGWKPDELLGEPMHDVIHHTKDDGSKYQPSQCPIYAAFTDGVVHRVDDEVFWRKDGTSFHVAFMSTPLRSDTGDLLGAVVTFRDISDRQRMDAELAALRRHVESILDSAGEGIYGLDTKGRTTFVNPAAATILGWEPAELLDKPQHKMIHHTKPDGSPYPAGACPIYAAFTDGQVHHVDNEVFWRKDGTSVPVEYISTPVRDENGELAGAVVTFNDISDRKRRESELRNALAEIEQLKERLQAENQYLRQEIKGTHNFEEMIGQSKAMAKATRLIEQVAGTDATVLVLGETGVGKELFARAIHNRSDRNSKPLIKVNCAALPATLIESELFGHEKGSFTGAVAQRIGRFELADGGTIFLDEVGELPLELQSKLLRVIQEGQFERLGSPDTITVDVRLVAATNRDLSKMVLKGEFRDDLYYRLNVFPVKVPSLRERADDIPLLVSHFVQKFTKKLGKRIDHIPEDVQTALREYDWPGNIRELENIIERAVILATDSTLRVEEALESRPISPASTTSISGNSSGSLEDVERAHILDVLEQTGWRIGGDSGAATILDLHPNTLRSRMKKLGITKD